MTSLVVSPCSNPDMELEEVFAAYAALGYTQFEMFTEWAKSHAEVEDAPAPYLELAKRYGFAYTSMHLPPINEDLEGSLERAVRGARFARDLGAGVVLFKATSRPLYLQAAGRFLDAIAGLGVTPVLQNHCGTPLSSLEDCAEVIAGLHDSRLRTLLEVGHFHKAGVPWAEAYPLLRGSLALVHLKDMVGPRPVPFGTGEVDFPGLFAQLKADGYSGNFVIEMEVPHQTRAQTLQLLGEAREYIEALLDRDI